MTRHTKTARTKSDRSTSGKRKPTGKRRGAPVNPRSQARLARRLGVSREHLNRVLNGQRTSERLMTRYTAILQSHHYHDHNQAAA